MVVSGDEGAVGEVVAHFAGLGRRVRRLVVSHAFHSPRMEGMLEEFRTVLKGVEFGRPGLAVVSTLSGRLAGGEDLRHAEYWVRQVREGVRYADAVGAMREAGVTTFLEIGPDGILTALTAQAVPDPDAVTALASVRAGRPEAESVVRALGELHARGVRVDWEAYFAGSGARRVPLPTYAFQRRRHWLDQTAPADGDQGRTPVPPTAPRAEPAAESAGAVPLTERLADLAGIQRETYVLQAVTAQLRRVLKLADPTDIAPVKPFQELGLDSLTGVELRNRLAADTGLKLPATVIFDHPSPAALTAYLLDAAAPAPADPATAVRTRLDELETSLGALPDHGDARTEAATRLRRLLEDLTGQTVTAATPAAGPVDARELIEAASADDIFDFIDTRLGRAAD
ncbi:phosphopantetheine-binding protein [Streptomyces similanensis]